MNKPKSMLKKSCDMSVFEIAANGNIATWTQSLARCIRAQEEQDALKL